MRGRSATRRRTLTYGGVYLTGGLVGCLGGEDPDHGLGNPEPYVDIRLGSDGAERFIPSIVHLVEGGMVEWVVDGGVHDVTAYHPATRGPQRRIPDGADLWASDTLSGEGATFDHVFETEGVYDYACTRHEGEGMVGSVVVGWPEPEGQPGLEPPAGAYPETAVGALESLNDEVRDFLEAEHEDG
jgi:plastocyanin